MASTVEPGWLHHVNSTLSFLGYTLPDQVWVDLLRLGFIVIALVTALLSFRVAKCMKFNVFWGAGTACIALVLIELQQLGERFVPWRLPIFWIAVIMILRGANRVLREW